MTDRDFFMATDETLSEIMDELSNANYGLVKDKVGTLSWVIEYYKRSIEDRKEMASKSIKIELVDRVTKLIAEKLDLGYGAVQLGSRIIEDLGADSLDSVEIIMVFEDEFDIEIPDEDAEKIKTVSDVIVYLSDKV